MGLVGINAIYIYFREYFLQILKVWLLADLFQRLFEFCFQAVILHFRGELNTKIRIAWYFALIFLKRNPCYMEKICHPVLM